MNGIMKRNQNSIQISFDSFFFNFEKSSERFGIHTSKDFNFGSI
jgi:hypothetical protein